MAVAHKILVAAFHMPRRAVAFADLGADDLDHVDTQPDSFSAAQRDAAVAALRAGGHAVEVRDLHAEGFAPALGVEERGAYYDEARNRRGVEDHAAALRRAEGLLLVYPTSRESAGRGCSACCGASDPLDQPNSRAKSVTRSPCQYARPR